MFIGVNARGQILLAKAFGVSWVAYPKTTLLLQAATYRHYQLIHQESVEFDGTIDVKKDRRRSDRALPRRHFDARTESLRLDD